MIFIDDIKCVNCSNIIDADRLTALHILGKPIHEFTCISCAPNSKVKGMFLGESGNSQFVISDKLGESRVIREPIETFFDKAVV